MLWLYKLEHKIGRYAIRHLMLFIVIGQAGIFLIDYFVPDIMAASLIDLNISLVLQGQVWRLLTFIFVPTDSSLWAVLFTLYFYFFIGTTLEKVWGSFFFGVFYFTNVLGAIAAAFITGYGVNLFINLSLFVAFAVVSPDYEFLLFFFIRIKAKWLALIHGGFAIVTFILSAWPTRAAILSSLVVLALFFARDAIAVVRKATRFRKSRNHFRTQMREWEREFSRNQRRTHRPQEDKPVNRDNED